MTYTATDIMMEFTIGVFIGVIITGIIIWTAKTWKEPKKGDKG